MILLHGYYGEQNAGDDAFTSICVEQLAAQHGPVRVMAAELPRVAAMRASPLLLRRRWWGLADRVERQRIRTTLAAGARVILGGGSLLRDSRGIAEVRHLLVQSPTRGHAALGISIGPWRDSGAEAACADLLPRFDFIGVRDRPSLERARQLSPEARVELTFDLAPLLMPEMSTEPRTGGLGIALCGPMVDDAQLDRLAGLCSNWLNHSPSRRVILLPFNVHPRKGDVALHQRLAARLGGASRVAVEPYAGDPRVTWRRIAQLDALIAMRLHAGIFGYCSGTPTMLVPYEEKCHAWAEMIGQPAELMRTLSDLMGSDLERLGSGASGPVLGVDAARAAALRNFQAIDP